ncbi:uncharacterized protein HD556DRAFT_1448600 [Suillus plorans]|uniref:Uncharacterized protein n=1 Tax=Suillus plorans TaxID=116603 RepID=A0A9P7DCS5_9AGAM|nr:uncharacterized protein HD556DRAFT_1448600 [Suillus plorans]KAG1787594.1 hypothetical protein HD556DRAFT_1448600 [Suillus plorans]
MGFPVQPVQYLNTMDNLNFVFPDPPGHLSDLDGSNQSCPPNLYKTPGRGHQVPSYPQFYPTDHSANMIPPAMHGLQLDPNLAYSQNLFNNIDPYMFASLSDPAFYPPLPSLCHLLEQRDTEDTSAFQNSVVQHDTPQGMPSLPSVRNKSTSDDSPSNSEDRTHHSSTHQNLPATHDTPPDVPPVSSNELTSNTDNRHETTQDTGTIVQGCASKMVPEANNLSWAVRNPSRPVLVPRAPLNAMQKGRANAQRALHKILAQQRKEAEDALHMAIQKALSEHEEKTNHLTIEHGITVEKVKKLMGGERHYKGN